MDSIKYIAAAFLILVITASVAWAHKPVTSESDTNSYETALEIQRQDISQVFYTEIDPESPYVWLTFEGEAGEEVYFSMGIPVIDRLNAYRPSLALIGPGLPDLDVHFEAPAKTGVIYSDAGSSNAFYEPVTGTDSLVIIEERVTLPATGRFYIVSFHADELPERPKLWLAIGTKERFGLRDILSIGRIRRETREFHEVD